MRISHSQFGHNIVTCKHVVRQAHHEWSMSVVGNMGLVNGEHGGLKTRPYVRSYSR